MNCQHLHYRFFFPQNLTGELALNDLHEDRVRGEMMDLQHGAAFIKSARIIAGAGKIYC